MKKIIILFVITAILSVCLICIVSYASVLGDVNGDGIIDSDDAMLILKYDVRLYKKTIPNSVGDVSGDGYVDSDDAMYILKYDVKNIHVFPGEKSSDNPSNIPVYNVSKNVGDSGNIKKEFYSAGGYQYSSSDANVVGVVNDSGYYGSPGDYFITESGTARVTVADSSNSPLCYIDFTVYESYFIEHEVENGGNYLLRNLLKEIPSGVSIVSVESDSSYVTLQEVQYDDQKTGKKVDDYLISIIGKPFGSTPQITVDLSDSTKMYLKLNLQ